MLSDVLRHGVRNRRDRGSAAAVVFALMVLSLLMGITRVPGSQAPAVLWAVFALSSALAVRVAFPDVWNYLFWLVAVYAAAFAGALCFTALPGLYPENGVWLPIFGLMLELLAVAVFVKLVLHVKGIRDEVAGITAKSTASARLDDESFERSRYVPLGIWSTSVVTFFLLANASAAGWYVWASGQGDLSLYIAAEVLLALNAIHVLWTVQTRFSWGEPPGMLPGIAALVGPDVAGASARASRGPVKCSACNQPATVEHRMCRSCGKPRDFQWCQKSEHYLIVCPSCGRHTTYGRKACLHCGGEVPSSFSCACGAKHPPTRWPRAEG